jgi:3-oxoacyl-[acyl-carrier protein] reductase
MDQLVTLITGTRKGLGHRFAEHYLDLGHIVVGCSRGEASITAPGYHHHVVDVSVEADVRRLFASIRSKFGRLDHLLNNAGIASLNHALLTPVETVKKILDTNTVGTFLFCREAAKLMKKRQYGRIVNFISVAARLRLEGEAVYAASKAAVLSFTQILAREFAEFGITVNAVGPTPIATDLIAGVPEDKIEKLIHRQAIHRLGTAEDVINIVDFFLRKESDFVTGQDLYLGGI